MVKRWERREFRGDFYLSGQRELSVEFGSE